MYSNSLVWQSSESLRTLEIDDRPRHVLSWEYFATASLPVLAAQVLSTTRTQSNDLLGSFQPRDGCADASSGILGPSHGYFGLVRGAPLQLYASDISLSFVFRPIISFLNMWPKSPTRSPIFSSSAYPYTVHVCHRGNLYPLAIS